MGNTTYAENELKEWKTIPGYSRYMASTDGEIRTPNWKGKGGERIMKPALDACGYMRTMLKRDGTGKYDTVKVHRIIAKTFLPNPENKPQVNHINAIKYDNRLENLEWCTQSENSKHAYKIGVSSMKGELNSCATISDSDVIEIRKNYVYGKNSRSGTTKKDIAEKYGVSFAVIKRIIQKKTFKHLL